MCRDPSSIEYPVKAPLIWTLRAVPERQSNSSRQKRSSSGRDGAGGPKSVDQAVKLDASYAPAVDGLAYSYAVGFLERTDYEPLAKNSAERKCSDGLYR